MVITKEHLAREIEALDEQQLREIADFIAFIRFKVRYSNLPKVDEQLGALYAEFAEEDQQLAEKGITEYMDMLKKEDAL